MSAAGAREEEHEPDYRFTLANERTFLAWLRTSLSLLAAGVAVAQLAPAFSVPGARAVTGGLLAALTLVIAVATAVYGRRRTARLRHAPMPQPLAARVAVPLLGCSVAVLAVLSGVAVIL